MTQQWRLSHGSHQVLSPEKKIFKAEKPHTKVSFSESGLNYLPFQTLVTAAIPNKLSLLSYIQIKSIIMSITDSTVPFFFIYHCSWITAGAGYYLSCKTNQEETIWSFCCSSLYQLNEEFLLSMVWHFKNWIRNSYDMPACFVDSRQRISSSLRTFEPHGIKVKLWQQLPDR